MSRRTVPVDESRCVELGTSVGRFCSPVRSDPIVIRPSRAEREAGGGALFGSMRREPPVKLTRSRPSLPDKLTRSRASPLAGVGEIVSSEICISFGA
ncbi:unannotated protein [freshwater metagenome]|uniref:Unannotated protein n=1 Tax=freshwater metagenome TaxID=449393 RepID=A0A6J6BSS5_9ZZZZ